MPVRDQAKGGAPRKYGDRLVLNGIFFVLRSGCQWRMIPRDLLRLALLSLAWLCIPTSAWAQDLVRVEARVTAISTGNVFIDRGLEAGLRIDDDVTIDLDTGFTGRERL